MTLYTHFGGSGRLVEPPPVTTPVLIRNGLFFEGCVYNMTDEETIARLQNQPLGKFVTEADGDFLGILEQGNSVTVFNDKWGRLPTYYTYQDGVLAVARSMVQLLPYVKNPKPDKAALNELLVFGHPLGSKTLIQGINYLLPAQMIVNGEVQTIRPLNFSEPNDSKTRNVCLQSYLSHFLSSAANRCGTLQKKGYKITADLSGGRDTRMVTSALYHMGADVLHFSIGFCHEESSALRIAQLYGFPLVISPEAIVDETKWDKARDIVWKYGCGTDYHTLLLTDAEFRWRRQIFGNGLTACFGGFAGEFVKRPYRIRGGSIAEAVNRGQFCRYLTTSNVALVTGNPIDLSYFDSYPEPTTAGKVRHLYFDYYNRLVNSGEDRTRETYWTVHPFWGKPFDYQADAIPDKYIDVRFFDDLMGLIDRELLTIPFTDGTIMAPQTPSFWDKLPPYWKALAKDVKHRLSPPKSEPSTLRIPIMAEYDRLRECAGCFSREGLDRYLSKQQPIYHQRMIMSAILFLQRLERECIHRRA